MQDELNTVLNTNFEHESHMSQINENIFMCRWGYPFKNDKIILGNILVFRNCFRENPLYDNTIFFLFPFKFAVHNNAPHFTGPL